MSDISVIKLSDVGFYSSIKKNLDDKKCSLQFLPISLSILSQDKYIIYKNQKLKTSYIVDIIHNLILKYYFKKDNKFNLMASILKEKYGYLYNYYIDYLIENKILVLLSKHIKGKHSRVYAISENILRGKIIRYQNYDKVLLKKYKNNICDIEDNGKEVLIKDDVKEKLVNDLFHVKIQFDRAIFYLDALKDDDTDIYNRNRYSVECISDKHIFYHFDNYGRFHSNFTILKSFIRKNCLLIDDVETCELDISNSQPLFLTKLIQDSGTKWVKEDEFELFRYLTINGKYYQYLMDKLNIKDKKEAKELTYKVLFGRNSVSCKSDKLFIKLFPTIHNFIKLYKKEFGDYKILAHDLQKAESNLIFNKIIKQIMTGHPEVKLITVHDSIVFPSKYKKEVEYIFNQKIKEEFNI